MSQDKRSVRTEVDGDVVVDVNDISAGTQTNDVKVTLDSEAVVLGAGTATFGKLAANSGVDIGDVDVTSVIPGVGATNLGKAEDAVHASGDVGVMALAVRQDSQVDFGADGDYVPLSIDADGNLRTSASVTINSEKTDDAAFTPGTSVVSMIGAEFDDTTPDSVDEGDAGAIRMSANRNLYVRIRDNAGNERGLNIDANGALAATVTGTVDLGATDNAVLDAIAASVAAIDTDTTTIIGHVDGIEGLLTTIDADTSTLAAVDYATQTTLAAINAKLVSGTDIGDVTINNTAANPVPVYITDASEVGVTAFAERDESAALAAQASETLFGTALQASKTGRLQQVTISSEVPFKAVVRKTDETPTTTTIVTLYGEAGATVAWSPKNASAALFEVASDGTPTAKFDVVVTNNNASGIGASGAISGTLEWDEE